MSFKNVLVFKNSLSRVVLKRWSHLLNLLIRQFVYHFIIVVYLIMHCLCSVSSLIRADMLSAGLAPSTNNPLANVALQNQVTLDWLCLSSNMWISSLLVTELWLSVITYKTKMTQTHMIWEYDVMLIQMMNS